MTGTKGRGRGRDPEVSATLQPHEQRCDPRGPPPTQCAPPGPGGSHRERQDQEGEGTGAGRPEVGPGAHPRGSRPGGGGRLGLEPSWRAPLCCQLPEKPHLHACLSHVKTHVKCVCVPIKFTSQSRCLQIRALIVAESSPLGTGGGGRTRAPPTLLSLRARRRGGSVSPGWREFRAHAVCRRLSTSIRTPAFGSGSTAPRAADAALSLRWVAAAGCRAFGQTRVPGRGQLPTEGRRRPPFR